jgi:hypothetical protein
MSWFLLIAFAVVCAGLLAWGMREKGRIYEFPFLAGATFAAFVLPQLIGLRNDIVLPEYALEKTTFMSILCAGMCYLGYIARPKPLQMLDWKFDHNKLMGASAALTLIGAYFFFGLSRLPEDLREAAQWTGLPVAYLFFAQILGYGFALAVLTYATTRSRWALWIALFGSLFYVDRIFLTGRRGVTLEFAFIVLLCFWFGRKFSLPRPLMLAAVIFGTLLLHSTGDYRAVAMDDEAFRWKQLKEISFLENLKQQMTEGGVELENAVFQIAATDETKNLDFGLFHWNTLVSNYVPAQLLGENFKQSLMAPMQEDDSYVLFGHVPSLGSTMTGMVDAFGSFWYFGCLKFFLIGLVLRKVYAAAAQGHLIARVCYMLIITDALHTITHHTQWFVSPWVHMALFLGPALFFARARVSVVRQIHFAPATLPKSQNAENLA